MTWPAKGGPVVVGFQPRVWGGGVWGISHPLMTRTAKGSRVVELFLRYGVRVRETSRSLVVWPAKGGFAVIGAESGVWE
jgi:hypothetical protein